MFYFQIYRLFLSLEPIKLEILREDSGVFMFPTGIQVIFFLKNTDS